MAQVVSRKIDNPMPRIFDNIEQLLSAPSVPRDVSSLHLALRAARDSGDFQGRRRVWSVPMHRRIDAEQIIVAQITDGCIRFHTGTLEDPATRGHITRILERG